MENVDTVAECPDLPIEYKEEWENNKDKIVYASPCGNIIPCIKEVKLTH